MPIKKIFIVSNKEKTKILLFYSDNFHHQKIIKYIVLTIISNHYWETRLI